MSKPLIGAATSVSKDQNFDTLDALYFCVTHGIKLIQLYVDDSLLFNKDLIEEVRYLALCHGIVITCHSPYHLNKKCLSPILVSAALELMINQEDKKLIIHHDEYEDVKNSVEYIRILNERGLSVCIENYYQQTDEFEFQNTLKKYTIILEQSKKMKFSLSPVIDFPRLFLSSLRVHSNSLLCCETICESISIYPFSSILHCIDFTDYSQERQSWCVLGNGGMPYKKLFAIMNEKNIVPDHIVLEYEKKKMFLESVQSLQRIYSESSKIN